MAANLQTYPVTSPPPVRQPAVRPWPFSSQRLVEQLAARGIVPVATLSSAIADATAGARPVATVLLERGAIADTALRDAMSQIFGLPAVSVSAKSAAAVEGFPAELARRHVVLPLGVENDRAVVAVADPTRASALREIRAAVGRTLDLRVAAYGELAAAVSEVFAPRVVVKGPRGLKTTIFLPPGDLKIGRASHNEIVVADPGVSVTHAILRGAGDRYQIVDFGSRNGVFVNGERIKGSRELRDKDRIRVGSTELKFKWPYRRESESSDADERRATERMRAAWITFAGRIISKTLGAVAIIILGLAIGGGLPQSCSTPRADQDAAVGTPAD
jgi:hypothetical protein